MDLSQIHEFLDKLETIIDTEETTITFQIEKENEEKEEKDPRNLYSKYYGYLEQLTKNYLSVLEEYHDWMNRCDELTDLKKYQKKINKGKEFVKELRSDLHSSRQNLPFHNNDNNDPNQKEITIKISTLQSILNLLQGRILKMNTLKNQLKKYQNTIILNNELNKNYSTFQKIYKNSIFDENKFVATLPGLLCEIESFMRGMLFRFDCIKEHNQKKDEINEIIAIFTLQNKKNFKTIFSYFYNSLILTRKAFLKVRTKSKEKNKKVLIVLKAIPKIYNLKTINELQKKLIKKIKDFSIDPNLTNETRWDFNHDKLENEVEKILQILNILKTFANKWKNLIKINGGSGNDDQGDDEVDEFNQRTKLLKEQKELKNQNKKLLIQLKELKNGNENEKNDQSKNVNNDLDNDREKYMNLLEKTKKERFQCIQLLIRCLKEQQNCDLNDISQKVNNIHSKVKNFKSSLKEHQKNNSSSPKIKTKTKTNGVMDNDEKKKISSEIDILKNNSLDFERDYHLWVDSINNNNSQLLAVSNNEKIQIKKMQKQILKLHNNNEKLEKKNNQLFKKHSNNLLYSKNKETNHDKEKLIQILGKPPKKKN
ncbi:hypothetical protein M0813_16196 [Anaeramoeba flamelloides]|uniref:Uncharacterized protein n=1 Tax=Anaeramoeba flamelloides TaxID=1746091 RepID=A0ABQ8Z082_9EUKA|nr:hypothetical protein M0813_16196 [Anaeramoeba flamelloides]